MIWAHKEKRGWRFTRLTGNLAENLYVIEDDNKVEVVDCEGILVKVYTPPSHDLLRRSGIEVPYVGYYENTRPWLEMDEGL